MDENVSSLVDAPRVTRLLLGNKVWLTATRDLPTDGQVLRLRGYIDETFLSNKQYWQRLSPDSRARLESMRLAEAGEKLEQSLSNASTAIQEYLEACAAEGHDPDLRSLREYWASGEANLVQLPKHLKDSLQDMRATKRHALLAEQIYQVVKLSDYPSIFPVHGRRRRLIAVLGPTNSGKTHEAFERLATASSGVYLGPLRLLALEAYTRLNSEFGATASLVTGEERRLQPDSTVVASTIEMLDPAKEVEVAVIDEIQMLNDPDRGWAWVQAVVGANASEIWMLGALSAEPAVKALAKRLGLPLEIRKKVRKHPLEVGEALAGHPAAALKEARKGDAFIVFSRRDALNLRDDLLALKKTVACIYGALSPEVREREAQRFASGEADILVATDAIGMGLNLPIHRVVFTSVQKYDGYSRAELAVPLLQQIGGRAGRYGHLDSAGIVAGLTPAEHNVVAKRMGLTQQALPSSGFQITAGSLYLEKIAEMAGDTRLEALFSLFVRHADCGDGFFKPYIPEEQLNRAAQLDVLKHMSLGVKHIFSMAPMPVNQEESDDLWWQWARTANKGLPVKLDFLPGKPDTASLEEAELALKLLAAYRWLGHRLPETFVDYEVAEDAIEPWTEAVDKHLRSKYRQGVGGGKSGMPSWYWGQR